MHDSGNYSFTDQGLKTTPGPATYGIRNTRHLTFDFLDPEGRLIYDHIQTHVMETILHFHYCAKLPSGGEEINIGILFALI
jgi:hypothetical protein